MRERREACRLKESGIWGGLVDAIGACFNGASGSVSVREYACGRGRPRAGDWRAIVGVRVCARARVRACERA